VATRGAVMVRAVVATDPRVYGCKRCGWKFVTRRAGKPVRCGRCKSPYWDRERMRPVAVSDKAPVLNERSRTR
jgi:predicted Zn-ribbon and HTH transcriptional regulator